MVDRQFFTAGFASAILTHKVVAFEHVASTECDNLYGKSVITSQRDDFRNFQCQPLRADDGITISRANPSLVFPAIDLEVRGIDDPSGFVPHFNQRTRHR